MRSDVDHFDVSKLKIRHVVRVQIETRYGLRKPVDVVCICGGNVTDTQVERYAIQKMYRKLKISVVSRMDSTAEIMESEILYK